MTAETESTGAKSESRMFEHDMQKAGTTLLPPILLT